RETSPSQGQPGQERRRQTGRAALSRLPSAARANRRSHRSHAVETVGRPNQREDQSQNTSKLGTVPSLVHQGPQPLLDRLDQLLPNLYRRGGTDPSQSRRPHQEAPARNTAPAVEAPTHHRPTSHPSRHQTQNRVEEYLQRPQGPVGPQP